MNIRIKLSSFILPAFTLLLFALTYWLFGFYYETNDDVQMELFFRGITVPEGSWDLYYWHRFTGYLFLLLYSAIPALPWYGILMYLFLFLAAVNYFIIIKTIMASHKLWKSYLIFFAFYIFVLFENIVLLNFLRVSILLALSGFLLMAVYRPLTKNKHSKILLTLYSFICCLLSVQIRPEGGQLLVGLLFIMLGFFFLMENKIVKTYLYAWIVLSTAVLLILGYDKLIETPERTADEKTIPYIQTLINYQHPENLRSMEDSLKINIALSGFFWDGDVMDQNFYHSVTPLKNYFDLLHTDVSRFTSALYHQLFILLKNHIMIAFIYSMILMAFLINFYKNNHIKQLFLFIIMHGSFWAMMTIVNVYYKMPHRLFTPMLVFIVLINLLLTHWLKNVKISLPPLFSKIIVVVSITALIIHFYKTHQRGVFLQTRCERNYEFIKNTCSINDYLIFYTHDALSVFNGLDPLKMTPLSDKNTYIISGWFNWYHAFRDKILLICSSYKFIDLINYTYAHQHMIISSDRNIELIINHIKIFYKKNIRIETVDNDVYMDPTYRYKIMKYKIITL